MYFRLCDTAPYESNAKQLKNSMNIKRNCLNTEYNLREGAEYRALGDTCVWWGR